MQVVNGDEFGSFNKKSKSKIDLQCVRKKSQGLRYENIQRKMRETTTESSSE